MKKVVPVELKKFVEIVINLLDSVPLKVQGSSNQEEQFLENVFKVIKKRKGYVETSDAILTGRAMRAQLKTYEW